MKQAFVNLFDFTLGIGIEINDERYNITEGSASNILEFIHNYNVDEIVLAGPNVITKKYKQDLEKADMSEYNNRKYIITTMEV